MSHFLLCKNLSCGTNNAAIYVGKIASGSDISHKDILVVQDIVILSSLLTRLWTKYLVDMFWHLIEVFLSKHAIYYHMYHK